MELTELLHCGFRYAISLTQDKMHAEDLLQDAWLNILRANGPLKKSYLFTTIRNQFINQYKRDRLVSIVAVENIDQLTDSNLYESDKYYADITEVELALSRLRPLEREALFLSAVEGYTAQEIAKFTQQPRGTVLSLIHRAKKKVRQFLDKTYQEASS